MVDKPPDNMLDNTEFGNAIHLIQQNLCGHSLPTELPDCLNVESTKEIWIPYMSTNEYAAYKGLYHSLKKDVKGLVQASIVKEVLDTSMLPQTDLAHIWNLADTNRDGKLDLEEFTIACHLTRFCKKGKKINGPVNVQSILPHKLPKTDLVGKRKRLSLLEKKKHRLMALREQRKLQSLRESKRVELCRKRLEILSSMHHILRENPNNLLINMSETTMNTENENVKKLQAVADRLKKEDEQVRKVTTRVIIDEQKLSKEVQLLEEEAEKLRKRRQRNSLIKDLDPFHQLYEERKEEKLSGSQPTIKKEEIQIVIPAGQDPFNVEKLSEPPLSGEEIFSIQNNNNLNGSEISDSTCDTNKLNPYIMELTQGFEDNFVEYWTERTTDNKSSDDVEVNLGLKELDSDFVFNDQVDTVFKTVPVTAEEDDLWSTLSCSEGLSPPQKEEFQLLQNELSTIKEHMKDLQQEGPQVVFKDPDHIPSFEDNPFSNSESLHLSSSLFDRPFNENRKYKSLEKDDSQDNRSRILHVVERRKKRIAADPNYRSSVNKNVESILGIEDSTKTQLLQISTDNPDENLITSGSEEKSIIEQDRILKIDTQSYHNTETIEIEPNKCDYEHNLVLSPTNAQDTVQLINTTLNQTPNLFDNNGKFGDQWENKCDYSTVQKREFSNQSDRLEKAKTWCVSDSEPIAPPRKKSQRKKTTPPEEENTDCVISQSISYHSYDSSIDSSSPSPKRPPRKGSPSKKKRSPVDSEEILYSNPASAQSSCPTSPILLSEARRDHSFEGTASSESSPIAPPRLKRGSKRIKSPQSVILDTGEHPPYDHDLEKFVSSQAKYIDSDTCKSHILTKPDICVSDETNNSELAKEIEALFDHVNDISSFQEESQKNPPVNLSENKAIVGKASTSDYCSQSDGSLIDDEMEAAARKQELEKLRDLYFGSKSTKELPDNSKKDTDGKHTEISTTEISVSSFNSYPLEGTSASNDTRSETESKRDSGFLEDAFSSVNFEIDPFQPQSQPTKISLDLDAYQSEFENSLDTSTNSKQNDCTKSSEDHIYSDKTKSVFSEGSQGNKKNSLGNGSLINVDYDWDKKLPCQDSESNNVLHNDGNDSDSSDHVMNFKAEFDPFASGAGEKNVFESPESNEVTLISYQTTTDVCSGTTESNSQNLFDDTWSNSLAQNSVKEDTVDSLFNLTSDNNENEDIMNGIPPPLPSEPPPPLPASQPPNLDSLRSALKMDNNSATDMVMLLSDFTSNVNNVTNPQGNEDNNITNIALVGNQPNNAQLQVSMNESSSQVLKSQGKNYQGEQNELVGKDFNFESGITKNNEYKIDSTYEQVNKDVTDTTDNGKIKPHSDEQDSTNYLVKARSLEDHKPVLGMDPVTGLRRTNVSNPVEKALKFVQDTEPTFRVKKKVHTSEEDDESYLTGFKTRAQEIQDERQEILDSMKIKKKNFDNWYPDNESKTNDINYYYAIEDHGVDFQKSAESEKKYEERKKKLQEQLKQSEISPVVQDEKSPTITLSSNNLVDSHTYVVTTQVRKPFTEELIQADVDSTSLTEQKQKTKQHWEETFSSPDVQLFPGDAKPATGKVKVKPVVKSTNYEKRVNDHESAIDREIRLAQEREEELRREKEIRLQEASMRKNKESDKVKSDSVSNKKTVSNMPIHKISSSSTTPSLKVTSNVTVETKSMPPKYTTKTVEMLSPQSYRELTEADRDSVPKQESIIEREIREQMQREEALRQEGSQKSAAHANKKDKEAEQSEYEHREKEQERLVAHESIIEREIRLQRERDQEVQRLRALSRGEPSNIVIQHTQAVTKAEPVAESIKVSSNIASNKPNYSPTVAITNYSGVHPSQNTDMPRNYNPSTGNVDPDITYSDAIAGGHHEGESLIAKELREQREREEELRQHWESLGFNVPKNARDPPDTPYNMPEPRQPPPMKSSFSVPGSLSNTSQRFLPTYQKDLKHSTSYDFRNVNNTGANSGGKSGRRGSTDSASSRSTDHSQLGETSQVNKSKVQPYRGDSDDEESDMYRFVPLTETPVEREIRLAKEREDALRKEKGLPSNSSTNGGDHQSEVMFEVRGSNRPTQLNYRKGLAEDDKGTMKRFASSRLQLEIEKEKQREMDLKSVGKINTLSEERIGPSTKYIDIISKDGPPLMPKSPITPKGPSNFTISHSTKSVDHTDYSVPVQNGPTSSGFVQVTPTDTRSRSEPIVVKRFPSEYSIKQKAGSSGAESMIERELREMKEREDELRAQRERVSGKVVEPPEEYGTSQFEVQYRHNGTGDNTVKANRRKSALAEEWEKKFGAAS